MEWQPIKTAPKKKGVMIFGYADGRIFLMQWSWFHNHNTHKREYRWIDEKHENRVSPTHWMPLPKPPKEK